jgi:squalene synthase HpnC
MSIGHYENFPVASWLLPAALRRPIEVIYTFARNADDFADEGDVSDAQRLSSLEVYRAELDRIGRGEKPRTALFDDVATIIARHELPIALFYDLLDAFSQDVTKKRYASFADVLDYCRRSANPIGRLLVHLYRRATPQNLAYSDAICSALQLINFWQDVAVDYAKDRIYLPQDEMAAHGVSEDDIRLQRCGAPWQGLMQFQCRRARDLLESGRPLARILPGRAGLELRFVLAGGKRILDKIAAAGYDVFRRRPVLTKRDWIALAPGAVFA